MMFHLKLEELLSISAAVHMKLINTPVCRSRRKFPQSDHAHQKVNSGSRPEAARRRSPRQEYRRGCPPTMPQSMVSVKSTAAHAPSPFMPGANAHRPSRTRGLQSRGA